jgi:hypothetical protein
MESFFTLCALILGFGIIRLKGTARLILFLIGIMFFQERVNLFHVVTFHQFLIYILILSECFDPQCLKNIKSFPLIIPLTIIFIGYICMGMFNDRHPFITNAKVVFDTFSSTFLFIYLFYSNFKKDTNWKKFYNYILASSLLLCVYGFYSYVTKTDPYDRIITTTYHTTSAFDTYSLELDGRFRINSFVSHPIYYGYLLGVLLLFLLCHFINISKQKKISLLVIVFVFANLLLTNSRTPLIATFFGIATFMVLSLNENVKYEIALYSIFICLAVYNVPFIQAKINNSIDIFQSGGEKTNGSSIDMRTKQFDASYAVFLKKPITGNGLGYIVEGLGFNAKDDTYDSDFKGFESYLYDLLIEQGIIGMVTNAIFFVWVIVYFLKRRTVSKQLVGLGLGIIVMFLIFIFGTGSMGSWPITMGALGMLIASFDRFSEINNFINQTKNNLLNDPGMDSSSINNDLIQENY